MRTYQGEYGANTVMENNLMVNQLLYPQISKHIIREYPQYALSFITEGLGRYAKETIISGRKYEWWLKGRLSRPMTATGTATGTGAAGAVFTIEFVENYFNSNDIIRFRNGQQALVVSAPMATAGGYTYSMVLQTINAAEVITAANYAAGVKCGCIGNAFPEMSQRGYGNTVYPDKYVTYLTISRKEGSSSGAALTDVTWSEQGGQSLWFWSQQEDTREKFFFDRELSSLYGKANVDASDVAHVFQNGQKVESGDGLLAQIDGGNMATYTPGLTERQITNFLSDLRYTNGEIKANYTVLTGTAGLREFEQAMKDYWVATGQALSYDMDAGKEIKLGGTFKTYEALDLKITLMYSPILDDSNLHHDMAADGYPKESYKMIFLNTGMLKGGTSNLEIMVKGANNINRGYIVKYIAGMVDPFDQKAVRAANATDGFTFEYLSDSGVVLRRPKSCGILSHG